MWLIIMSREIWLRFPDSLTRHYYGLFTELLRQVGPFGQTVQVPFQDVPAHLIIEGETELGMNLERGTPSASEQKAECLIFQLKPQDLFRNWLNVHGHPLPIHIQ